ncbi:MAG: DNA primase small subunit PriS [Sulfolobaceae archaeon]|nr:DNA primase small subunit PriS [Sulfolobaceae archaeon]
MFFTEYYSKAELILPDDMELREFAVQPFGGGPYIRHLSFTNPQELKAFVLKTVPLHLYYSVARYQLPAEKDLEAKGWLGSDLLFDLDADEVCGGSKKIYLCQDTGTAVEDPSTCSNVEEYFEIDKDCVEKLKESAKAVVDILKQDFGLSPIVSFSGNRGFHIRVPCFGDCALLPPEARQEIAMYVSGEKVPEYVGSFKEDPGWPGRQARGISHINIDKQVTIDIRRLERIENSINGKSGLIVKKVDDIDSFEFGDHLSPFRGVVAFLPSYTVELTAFSQKVKLEKDVPIKLDASVGVYLALKGLGVVKAFVR